jgi:hypothetical protein
MNDNKHTIYIYIYSLCSEMFAMIQQDWHDSCSHEEKQAEEERLARQRKESTVCRTHQEQDQMDGTWLPGWQAT